MAAKGITSGKVVILMENDASIEDIRPIRLDINQIKILSVEIQQLKESEVIDQKFIRTSTDDEKVLELTLEHQEGVSGKMTLNVIIEFESQITNTLQGIYKVDYKDDFGSKDE